MTQKVVTPTRNMLKASALKELFEKVQRFVKPKLARNIQKQIDKIIATENFDEMDDACRSFNARYETELANIFSKMNAGALVECVEDDEVTDEPLES
jgi:hypothetical protein